MRISSDWYADPRYLQSGGWQTWNFVGGGDWNTLNNWNPMTVPDAIDATAIIPAGFPNAGATIYLSAGATIGTLQLDNNLGGAGDLTFDGGHLKFNSTMTTARNITLNAGNGTVATGLNTITLSGNIPELDN